MYDPVRDDVSHVFQMPQIHSEKEESRACSKGERQAFHAVGEFSYTYVFMIRMSVFFHASCNVQSKRIFVVAGFNPASVEQKLSRRVGDYNSLSWVRFVSPVYRNSLQAIIVPSERLPMRCCDPPQNLRQALTAAA